MRLCQVQTVKEKTMSHSKADDICLTCRHSWIDHSDFVGPCDYIKWIGGHPEYRCMCRTFVKRTTQCICIDHPVYGVEVNGECPLHGNPRAADDCDATEEVL